MDRVLFKIDFEKAYNKVKLDFIQQALCIKDFDKLYVSKVSHLFGATG
jgi:hypothetical protein